MVSLDWGKETSPVPHTLVLPTAPSPSRSQAPEFQGAPVFHMDARGEEVLIHRVVFHE